MPSAFEVDATGAVSMYPLQFAGGKAAALAGWNNNYEQEEDECAIFHCGNWARSMMSGVQMGTAPIVGSVLGRVGWCMSGG